MAHINRGDTITHGFLNNHEDVYEWWRRFKARGEGGGNIAAPVNFSKVMCANYTGEQIYIGDVCEFDGNPFADIAADDRQPEPGRDRWVKAVTPDLTRFGWGIAIDPIGPATGANREGGDFLVLGVCHAKVKIIDEGHKYAERETGERVLKSAASGPVKILHKPTGGTPPEQRLCLVQLMDEKGGEGPKLVRFTTLPAAYGGTLRTGITGSAATTNGNISPANTKYFPRYVGVYEISSGEIVSTGENIWVVNLGSLPLTEGWGIAHKWLDDPNYGQLWAVNTDLSTSHHGAACYEWNASGVTGGSFSNNWVFADGDAKLIRGGGFGLSTTTTNRRAWAFSLNSDIILTHVGRWEVTVGFQGRMGGGTPYANKTTSAASAGTAHTHTIKELTGGRFIFGVHRNFEPGTSVVASPSPSTWTMETWIPPQGPTGQRRIVQEKTFYIPTQLSSPWHGQHHTRLSLFGYFFLEGNDGIDGSDPVFAVEKFWLQVKPAMGSPDSTIVGNDDFMGAGANQYPLNDYSSAASGSGTFRWWGGGTEPPSIDQDGN